MSSLKSSSWKKFNYKKIKNKRTKDVLYGRSSYMKYRNAKILLKEYINDLSIDFSFKSNKNLSSIDIKKGEYIPNRDIFEAILISIGYEGMVKEGEIRGVSIPNAERNITDKALSKWVASTIFLLFNSDYPGDVVFWAGVWEKWYERCGISYEEAKEGEYKESIEILDVFVDRDTEGKKEKWEDLSSKEKRLYFDRIKDIIHGNGLLLSESLMLRRDIEEEDFLKYMDATSYILEEQWEPEKYIHLFRKE